MTFTRLKAAKLRLTIGGTQYWAEAASARLSQEYTQEGRYGSAAPYHVGQGWQLALVVVQSLTPGSLWRLLWDHPETVVEFRLAPGGNEVATHELPHFVGQAQLGPKPPLGGEASPTGSHIFETVLHLLGEPQTITD